MTLTILLAFLLGQVPAPPLLSDGGFERGGLGWSLSLQSRVVERPEASGGRCLLVESYGVSQDVPARPGEVYTLSARAKVEEITQEPEGGYAFLAIYQTDQDGDLLHPMDFAQLRSVSDWETFTYTFVVVEDAAFLSVRVGLFRAGGKALFDDFVLVPGQEPGLFKPSEVVAGEEPAGASVGLLCDASLSSRMTDGTASNPEAMADILQASGVQVALFSSQDLADPAKLSTIELLVLPYGPLFPAQAAGPFRAFLRRGGKFLSMGGYAFDRLLLEEEGIWKEVDQEFLPLSGDSRWTFFIQKESLLPQGLYEASGAVKTLNVKGRGFAFLAIYQYREDGSISVFKDFSQQRGTEDWQSSNYRFEVMPDAFRIAFYAGVWDCKGRAWFDRLSLKDPEGRELLPPVEDQAWQSSGDSDRVPDPVASDRILLSSHLAPREQVLRMNTRFGDPQDGLVVQSNQIGVFDADYRIERARSLVAAPGQALIARDLKVDERPEGYAASGVTGSNSARWVPLLNAVDAYGRLRGAAGALLRHYDGVWKGSSWCFFGITNQDLFAGELKSVLPGIVSDLLRDCYLTHVVTDRACYRAGQGVTVTVNGFCGGREDRKASVLVEILDGDGNKVRKQTSNLHFTPGQSCSATQTWEPGTFESDFYAIRCTLRDKDVLLDQLESGFVAWQESAILSGPKLTFASNALCLSDRPSFLFGTDDYISAFIQHSETPLQWQKDMMMRKDYGVGIYENLQWGWVEDPAKLDAYLNQTDALMQLTQTWGQVYFPCLLVGLNVAASEETLERQKVYCREYARRYKDIPGLIYYINGDLRCELGPEVKDLWNQFLSERYQGSIEALRASWGRQAPEEEWGEIPIEEYVDWGRDWDDLKVYDYNLFRISLVKRWLGALNDAIKEEDPGALTSAEFYQMPNQGVDLAAAIDGMDLANFGYFSPVKEDIQKIPVVFKYNDMRAQGKSFGPGEYGVKTHPAWKEGKGYHYHVARTREQAIQHFMAVAHYGLGLGGSRIHNWCWKDGSSNIFPWGMVYPGDGVPKDTLYVHRNQSLLFRQFEPVYQPPQVWILSADCHRMGGKKWEVLEGVQSCISGLLSCHPEDLGILREEDLKIPVEAKVIFYPLPFCVKDETFESLIEYVDKGGVLYLSGDISFDESRRRTRTERLEKLCGVRFLEERYSGLDWARLDKVEISKTNDPVVKSWVSPCIRIEPLPDTDVLWQGPEPVVVRRRLGKGQVFYTADPVELRVAKGEVTNASLIYQDVLEASEARTLSLRAEKGIQASSVHVMKRPMRDEGSVFILFPQGDCEDPSEVQLSPDKDTFRFQLRPSEPGLLWFDGKKHLRAVETGGILERNDERICEDSCRSILMSLDGQSLEKSKTILFMPTKEGSLSLNTQARWQEPVALIGDTNHGAFRVLEEKPASLDSETLQFTVTEDTVFTLILFCEENAPKPIADFGLLIAD